MVRKKKRNLFAIRKHLTFRYFVVTSQKQICKTYDFYLFPFYFYAIFVLKKLNKFQSNFGFFCPECRFVVTISEQKIQKKHDRLVSCFSVCKEKVTETERRFEWNGTRKLFSDGWWKMNWKLWIINNRLSVILLSWRSLFVCLFHIGYY